MMAAFSTGSMRPTAAEDFAMATVLIVPGLGDSGPEHWQTWLQARERTAVRVTQDDWTQPDLERWAARVREAIDSAVSPVWLVGHSFGCLASVQAAAERAERIAGALLVAPADPARVGAHGALFSDRLRFPSVLVASTTDPWLRFNTAKDWAERWGSRLLDLGPAGHINAESGYGPWPEGQELLHRLQLEQRPMSPPSSAGRPVPAARVSAIPVQGPDGR